jgi:hypothetical protein
MNGGIVGANRSHPEIMNEEILTNHAQTDVAQQRRECSPLHSRHRETFGGVGTLAIYGTQRTRRCLPQ